MFFLFYLTNYFTPIFAGLILLLLLLNVLAFSTSSLKLKTLGRITVVFHKSSSPLRSSAIMKDKITNSLKPSLTNRLSEVGYWELNEMPGNASYRLLQVSHKFLNF